MENMHVIADLEKSIDSLDTATLKATLAYLLKVYVIDKGPAYRAGIQELSASEIRNQAAAGPEIRDPLRRDYKNFNELMTALKRNYTLEELKLFTIEGGNVYITLEDKRYQLTSAGNFRNQQGEPPQPRQPLPPPQNDGAGFRHLEMD